MVANEALGCLFDNFGTNMDIELFADVTCKELSLFYQKGTFYTSTSA